MSGTGFDSDLKKKLKEGLANAGGQRSAPTPEEEKIISAYKAIDLYAAKVNASAQQEEALGLALRASMRGLSGLFKKG